MTVNLSSKIVSYNKGYVWIVCTIAHAMGEVQIHETIKIWDQRRFRLRVACKIW